MIKGSVPAPACKLYANVSTAQLWVTLEIDDQKFKDNLD